MTSSRISLAALFAAAVVACGGGGTGEGSGSPTDSIPGSEQPSYNDQAPPGNPNAPSNSYDPLPSSDDQPGSNPGGTPGGGGGPLPGGSGSGCSRICSGLAAKQCGVGSPGECEADCAEALSEDENVGCVNEFFAFYDCLITSPAFSCTPDEDGDSVPDVDDEEALAGCEAQVLDYVECAGLEPEPEPEPEPGGECSAAYLCVGCVEECDICLCVLEDESLCASSCAQ
jgi:hypothetical protein